MDTSKKQELKNAYKNKAVIGGVYCVECSGNHKKWIKPTVNMEGIKSRFEFSIKIGSCPEPSMRREWLEYGAEAFSFTCLEELEKGEAQTDKEFENDVEALCEMWLEKTAQEDNK